MKLSLPEYYAPTRVEYDQLEERFKRLIKRYPVTSIVFGVFTKDYFLPLFEVGNRDEPDEHGDDEQSQED
jgi:hypothetical protein